MLPDPFTFHKYLIIIFLTLIFQTSFSQEYDAEVINQETTIEIKDQKLVKKHFYAIRINNRNGDSYAEISIPFNKMNGISDLQAYILDDADKKVKSLRKALNLSTRRICTNKSHVRQDCKERF
jgi:hypothetical protein